MLSKNVQFNEVKAIFINQDKTSSMLLQLQKSGTFQLVLKQIWKGTNFKKEKRIGVNMKGRKEQSGLVVQNRPERSLSLERRLSWSRPPPRPLSLERDRLSLDRDRDLWRLWNWGAMNGYKTTVMYVWINVEIMCKSVPLPTASIELPPQFTWDGLQMHEVTEATTSALSVEREKLQLEQNKNRAAWQTLHTAATPDNLGFAVKERKLKNKDTLWNFSSDNWHTKVGSHTRTGVHNFSLMPSSVWVVNKTF